MFIYNGQRGCNPLCPSGVRCTAQRNVRVRCTDDLADGTSDCTGRPVKVLAWPSIVKAKVEAKLKVIQQMAQKLPTKKLLAPADKLGGVLHVHKV